MRQRQSRRWVRLVAVLGVLAVLAGCANSNRNSGASTAQDGAAPERALPEEAPTQEDGSTPNRDKEVGGGERALVYVGGISLRVDDVTEAADKAGELATTNDGFVAGDDRRATGGDDDSRQSYAELVLRVPSAKFSDTVTALTKLGKELRRTRKVEDVSKVVLDLDNRIASQQASVNRIRQLMARAQDMSQIVTLERELSQREADLASLLARKRDLSDKVTYSTITVSIYGPQTKYTPKEREVGFVAGLKTGWNAFTDFVVIVLTFLGAILPFVVALAIVVVPLVWFVRRRRRRRAVPPAAPGGGAPPVPTGPPPPAPVSAGQAPQP